MERLQIDIYTINIVYINIISFSIYLLQFSVTCRYIAKYSAKCETSSKSYLETLSQLCNKSNQQGIGKSIIMKFLVSTIGERDYSAQEVAHILMGWNLYKCSRSFVTVYIGDDNWNKVEVYF